MIGWLFFLILALVVLLPMLWPVRLGRGELMLVASALFVAAAGYAWQGHPGLAGAPAEAQTARSTGPSLYTTERERFLSKFGETGTVLATADSFNRLGLDEAAVGLLANAVAKKPKDADLRIGFAHALLVQADGHITPAVQLAYDRAVEAVPANPAPRYFRGLAALEAGDMAGAEQEWRRLAASLPAGSPWARPMADRLAMFDMIRGAAAQGRLRAR
jgi:cytochrome c-type biogenesis protein CcmH